MVRSLALELGPDQITVNAIAPGVIATPQALDPVNSLGPDGVAEFGAHVPLGRSGRPEDIAAAYLFLASDEAGYVTGQTIVVDGGVTLQLHLRLRSGGRAPSAPARPARCASSPCPRPPRRWRARA